MPGCTINNFSVNFNSCVCVCVHVCERVPVVSVCLCMCAMVRLYVRVTVVETSEGPTLPKTLCHSCTSLWQNSGLETVLRGTNWEDVDHMVNIICPCFVKVTPDFNFLL